MTVDPRLLADYDEAGHGWRVRQGAYTVKVGGSSQETGLQANTAMDGAVLKP